jgi:hypothetical protein
MFANDLVLDDQSGDDVTYRLFRQDASGSQRIDVATNLALPAIFKIQHSTTGKGNAAVDRHLVQITRTVANSAGLPVTLTLNFTLAVPRDTAITNQIVKDSISNLLDFLADGAIASVAAMTNVEALLRGEA